MGERVLVTGGAGFIGSHVVEELLRRGYEPIVYDIYVSPSQDVRNSRMVEAYMATVDACIHMAANPYIPFGYAHPKEFFEINANGTLNVLKAAAKHNTRTVYISTSEVYGSNQDPDKPMDESHPINPHSTYAVSKYAGDALCRTFHKDYGLDATVIRLYNSFGPKETWRYVIPEIIEQLNNGSTLHLGNIYAERDFTYVEDSARAIVDVLECQTLMGEVVNCGSGVAWSVENIAMMLAEIMRPGERVNIVVDESRLRPFDVDTLLCDYSKLHRHTGWEPEVSFHEGLRRTVEWFKANGCKWDFREVYV